MILKVMILVMKVTVMTLVMVMKVMMLGTVMVTCLRLVMSQGSDLSASSPPSSTPCPLCCPSLSRS